MSILPWDLLSPTMVNENVTISALILSLILFVSLVYKPSSKKLPLPPGPAPKFITGNVHQLPKSEPWKTYEQWSEVFKSPLIYIRIFQRHILILNSYKSVTDLLETRSAIYSDRPTSWMHKELVGRKFAVFNVSSSHPRFRVYRKLLHSGLNARAIEVYNALMEEETGVLLENLGREPARFLAHLRQNAGAVTLKLAYGWSVTGTNDPFVTSIEEALEVQTQVIRPGRWLVDVFPLLRFVPAWFPGADFKRKAAAYKEQMKTVDEVPYKWAKKQIQSGEYIPSFTSHHLLPEEGTIPDEEQEDIIKWCGGALYAGGADTTVSFMTSFFAAITLHPKVQKRAQGEIDMIIGRDRVPKSKDQHSLPYVSALIKEILRWAPPVPQGLPHCVTQDDEYLGYRIPKGSTVVANIWKIAHDPDLYPDPFSFSPERFLNSDSAQNQLDPKKFVFGFGRRTCPGAQFAELSIFLNVASILSAFTISKSVDDYGKKSARSSILPLLSRVILSHFPAVSLLESWKCYDCSGDKLVPD
ncbi:cytochrome P450 [Crucibulum laeve]|uniref:Cytochrome P450 n=1 Tax=Crucibulum laeve TaxID=68775 RepID=A0A5C3LNU9_9AGAR|nr:cytochrome P450 [Crucibulum laeve]